MCNVIFDFDYLNICIVSICELCVFVKGCLVFYVICIIYFNNDVVVCFLFSYLFYFFIMFSCLI